MYLFYLFFRFEDGKYFLWIMHAFKDLLAAEVSTGGHRQSLVIFGTNQYHNYGV